MRLLLLAALLMMNVLAVQAQVPFPTSNATWTNTQYAYVWNPPNPIPDLNLIDLDVYCVLGQDTTIQSNQYTAIYYCQYMYKGALREVNSAVYFVPADSTQEYLLYDFGAQVGQTLQNVYVGNHFDESFMLQDFTVQQTGTEIIGGISRRIVNVESYRWIEGIGCETGLFMEPWPNVSNYENRLECFTLNDQMVYPNESTEPCPYVFVDVNNPENSFISFEVYPNPTLGNINIQINSPISGFLVISNSLGQVVDRFQFRNKQQLEIELEGPKGLYMVEIFTESGERFTSRILRH
ncbi:MAG: T9SS type A sorting domain-containing protein [Flavobacteriales bacterium]|nr:T9SS type A sorting domain-containing protein [Flavobacteriales bacterium]MCB9203744.1 T9SS type A sorting domain-containing protein [Flavobacteriales bacterium]